MPFSQRLDANWASVTFYETVWTDDPRQWTLWLKNDTESVILQITDSQYWTSYRFDDRIYTAPWNTHKLHDAIHCGVSPNEHLFLALDFIRTYPLGCTFSGWSCRQRDASTQLYFEPYLINNFQNPCKERR
jgi:hypothetical protein